MAAIMGKRFSVGVYDRKHLSSLSRRLKKVMAIIDEAADRATAIGARAGYKDKEKDFHFDDFPQARREIDALLGELSSSLTVNVREAISDAWGMANKKNDAMVDSMVAGSSIPKKSTQPWFNRNERAHKAFLRRVKSGMNLSTDVWNLRQFKSHIELSLEMGLASGTSAAELSREVRSFLRYPNKLFRRVRDEKGVLRLSRAAKEFHPGQGVYRSSYKNALRLTATETNMAYRQADNLRWNQIDFVIGQHIEPSHTNHPIIDICDELQGDYPKDFVFTGWHPFCRCFSVPKMASPEEFMKFQQAMLNGEDVSNWQFEGEVKDVPGNFKEWIRDNEERISRAKSKPYFLKDNPKYTGAAATGTQTTPRKTPLEIAAERHARRTEDDIRRIQDLADERKYGKAYVDNVHKLEKALGMQRGKRMTHEQANVGKVNPNFGKPGYKTNCSTCSAVYILRRMGFDVEARANVAQNPLVQALSYGMTTWDKWISGKSTFKSTLNWMTKNKVSKMTVEQYRKFIDTYTKKPGVYEFNVGYETGGGHSTLLERAKDGTIKRIEQQTTSKYCTLESLLNALQGNPAGLRGIMRVDNARFNPKYAKIAKKVKSPKK